MKQIMIHASLKFRTLNVEYLLIVEKQIATRVFLKKQNKQLLDASKSEFL